ncbi:MAG TPA: pitrilysin family protein, partial [Terriglobales bacterium]|nr:pitrilysin family protein [Terriglobales bacterium]
MRHIIGLLTATLLLCGTLPARALQPYSERVREHVLDNGLKVLLLEDHKAPVGVVQLWYKVGSRNERPGFTGLAHVLEHMMFKGTKRYGPEEYSRIIKRNGGNENAFTSNDATTYFATLANDRLDIALELEADRMQNLSFAESEFTPELQVIMEERRMRVDNSPVGVMFEALRANAYLAHPYQWPVIGWMTDLEQATRSDALAFYKTHYQPNNAVLVAVGDFRNDDILERIEKHFGDIPAGTPPPVVRAIEPAQEGERRVTVRRAAELPYVAMAFHVPELGHADAYALEVAAAVLAGGRSSRLYEDLVYKRRLARSAVAEYDLISIDPSLFYLYAQPLP